MGRDYMSTRLILDDLRLANGVNAIRLPRSKEHGVNLLLRDRSARYGHSTRRLMSQVGLPFVVCPFTTPIFDS